jgi:proteasome assembly chaperone (PAC2) family protein
LLGLAELDGLEGVCLLGSKSEIAHDREAAFRVLRLLERFWDPPSKNPHGILNRFE